MKKLVTLITIAFLATATQAQTKVEKKLAANLNTIADVTKMLQDDYIFIENTATVIPNNTFKFGECMVLTEYADEGINKDAKSIEKDFNKNLGGSTWKFGAENNYSVATIQLAAMGKTEEGSFATQGGMFKVTNLIEGLDIQSGLYQSKKDKNTYMIMFGIRSGMACVADFTKQTGNITNAATDASGVTEEKNNATDAAKTKTKTTAKGMIKSAVPTTVPTTIPAVPAVPKVDDVKSKAKSKLLNKVKL